MVLSTKILIFQTFHNATVSTVNTLKNKSIFKQLVVFYSLTNWLPLILSIKLIVYLFYPEIALNYYVSRKINNFIYYKIIV